MSRQAASPESVWNLWAFGRNKKRHHDRTPNRSEHPHSPAANELKAICDVLVTSTTTTRCTKAGNGCPTNAGDGGPTGAGNGYPTTSRHGYPNHPQRIDHPLQVARCNLKSNGRPEQRGPDTPPVVPSLRLRICPCLLDLMAKGFSDRPLLAARCPHPDGRRGRS